MVHKEYKLNELFYPETMDNYSFPFNIKFKKIVKESITGPAIYIISLNGKIVYLGSYKKEKSIISARWDKHIQTNTCRGINVGFGSPNRFERMYRPIFEIKGIEVDTTDRLKDTGVVTAENKVKFCMNNWEYFKDMDKNLNLKFHIFKPNSDNLTQFKQDILQIERDLIMKINPPSNNEFNKDSAIFELDNAIKLILGLYE